MKHANKIVRVPAHVTDALLLPDIHVPKHDPHCIYLACEYGRKHNVGAVVLTGDVMDMTAFGRHGHNPEDEQIEKYFDETIKLLSTIRSKFPGALMYWTEGNHCLWFSRYLSERAPLLKRDQYFTLEKRLRLDDFGIQYLPEDVFLKFGDTYIAHGHQFVRGRFVGSNPAKTVFEATLEPFVIGHVHRKSEWMKKNVRGRQIVTHSTGCLSHLSPKYNPVANYSTGFAIMNKVKSRTFTRCITIEKDITF